MGFAEQSQPRVIASALNEARALQQQTFTAGLAGLSACLSRVFGRPRALGHDGSGR